LDVGDIKEFTEGDRPTRGTAAGTDFCFLKANAIGIFRETYSSLGGRDVSEGPRNRWPPGINKRVNV
jgi:hypothetical protein